ncbi:S1 family peptidase [Streptomyces sp. RKAG337]|uniref:S1 family peptidase n=1 Tax=Streptomyces sp. RKAG337 TaxID=2893404 RepID=UPI0020348793|nr:S1 family peptidase [Streptomyces sp. RKAG337]MCM2425188.1 alpha-lytic protease prodomain-containing protein [Streptomyces sp. RKAG337]
MIQLEVLELSHRHVNKRTGAITGAVAAVVAGVAILLPHANASTNTPQPPETFSSQSAALLAASLNADLGGKTAGWYLDAPARHLVVNVLSDDDARRVQSQGAIAKVVRNTMPALRDGVRTLSDTASIPGTAWSIDPKTNQIVVLADRTVTGTKMATLTRATDRLSGLVSVKRTSGEFTPNDSGGRRQGAAGGSSPAAGGTGGQTGGANATTGAIGGSAIFGGRAQCSLGFNVTVQGAPAFITAGHCGNESKTWAADQAGSQPLGTVADSRFPKTDFSLVKYDDPTTKPSSTVDLQNGSTQQITQAADAAVGMKVQRSGSRTGLKDGTVTGLDATVNYGNGDIVNGLIQTDVCAEPGDSGGPMFAGDAAVGLTSGGSGDCTQGGETFFQPVTAALAATGAVIGAGDAGDNAGAAGGDDANGNGASAGSGNATGGGDANGNDASAGSSAGSTAGAGDANGTDAGAGSGDVNGTDAGAGSGDANGTDAGAGSTTGATTGADGGDGQQ